MRKTLVTIAWTTFRKPHRSWMIKTYLAGARFVSSWSDWLSYRAQEWVMELEDLKESND